MPWKGILQKIYCLRDFLPSFFKSIQKQIGYCTRLFIKKKKKFNNFNPKFVSDNKLFWMTVKSLFSDKGSYDANIKLPDKVEIIVEKKKLQKH